MRPAVLPRTRRTWTDDELRAAIAGARSWRGVLRDMGRNDSSAGVVRGMKRRASELGLDTSHFTGARRWSDAQLRAAVMESTSWASALARLGCGDNAECRASVRGHAACLGLDISHLEPAALPPAVALGEPDLVHLRNAAPTFAMAWFQMRGAHPSVPADPRPYDLIVEVGPGDFRGVQIKTCISESGEVTVAPRVSGMRKSGPRIPYDPVDVSMFFIVDRNLDVYLIPGIAIYGKTGISLAKYEAYRVGSARCLMG
ncbi:hypothetical protein [Nonomuraea sp. 10N515B]|uniref:hypothetical protein n=1 Tax=Nonomuraea sp. 10N515B TaxID=3457422 RepID=UPI003FCDAF11